MPACRSIDLSVPTGRSRFGCGTVTRPGLMGCLNWAWLPRRATSTQPSASSSRMTSRLFIVCIYTHWASIASAPSRRRLAGGHHELDAEAREHAFEAVHPGGVVEVEQAAGFGVGNTRPRAPPRRARAWPPPCRRLVLATGAAQSHNHPPVEIEKVIQFNQTFFVK